MRILVIEDEVKVASFIQTGLEQEGYTVDVLHHGTARASRHALWTMTPSCSISCCQGDRASR